MSSSPHRPTPRAGPAPEWRRVRASAWMLAAVLLAGSFGARPAFGNASVFVNSGVSSCVYGYCTAASQFGLLIGASDALSITGPANIFNDIGIDNGGKITTSGTVNVGGPGSAPIVDFSDTMSNSPVPCTGAQCTGPAGTSFSTATTLYGGSRSNSALVDQAVTQFTDLASYWNGQSGQSRGAPTTSGNWNIDKAGSTSGIHLFIASNFTSGSNDLVIGCGSAGTSNVNKACSSTDLIVILLDGTSASSITRSITFAAKSGLTDDQLLFVINATGSNKLTIGTNGSRNIHGNFFAPNSSFTLGNTGATTNLYGRIFANGTDGATDTIRNTTIYDEPLATPEPATWGLMLSGIGAAIYARHRRRPRG